VIAPAADDVVVFTADVREHAPHTERLAPLLDAREAATAARFRFPADLTRYTVAHGLLRIVLGAVLACAPAQVRYAIGSHGKPALDAAGDDAPPAFNLSHAADRVLIALARRPVGVDVERCSDDVPCEQVAAFVFSAAERRELAALPADRKRIAFFTGWTRKEAYVKALGTGIGYGLDAFDVSLDPRSPRILADRGPAGGAAAWSLRTIDAGPGYSAAVAAAGSDWRLTVRTLEPAFAEQLAR
jgi:4'-phosphopantetheinyl transferase